MSASPQAKGGVSHTEFDLTEAQRFVNQLTRGGSSVTFQTFDDKRTARPHLVKVLHGSVHEHARLLSKLNADGAGIFVMVNEGDQAGRKAANVIAVRALFVDLDGAPLDPLMQVIPQPDLVIESSPGRFHAYWRVVDCALDEFSGYQKALAKRFNGDQKVCDLPRVMRLPGFAHRKAEPFLVRIENCVDRAPWDLRALADSLGLPARQKRDRSELKSFSTLLSPSVCEPLPQQPGERNEKLHAFARRMKADYPDATHGDRRQMVMRWYVHAEPACRTKDIAIYYADFERAWPSIRTPHGSELDKVLANLLEPPDDLKSLGYGQVAQQLLKVIYSLHHHQAARFGGEPIILGVRKAAEILSIDKNDAHKMLKCLENDGVIELVTRGIGHRASRWRWIWPTDHGVIRKND